MDEASRLMLTVMNVELTISLLERDRLETRVAFLTDNIDRFCKNNGITEKELSENELFASKYVMAGD